MEGVRSRRWEDSFISRTQLGMCERNDVVFPKLLSFIVLPIIIFPILQFTLVIYYHTSPSLHFATNLSGSPRVINHLGG